MIESAVKAVSAANASTAQAPYNGGCGPGRRAAAATSPAPATNVPISTHVVGSSAVPPRDTNVARRIATATPRLRSAPGPAHGTVTVRVWRRRGASRASALEATEDTAAQV